MSAPRIVHAHALDYCAEAVEHLLSEREASYPRLVAKGTLTAEAAKAGLNLMGAIAAQWRWVMDPAHPPLPPYDHETGDFGCHNYLLAAEMTRVAARAREIATARPDDFRACEMADLCEALAWYQQDEAGSAKIVMSMSCIRRLRAKVAAIADKAKAA
jgi:hypothetical protein